MSNPVTDPLVQDEVAQLVSARESLHFEREVRRDRNDPSLAVKEPGSLVVVPTCRCTDALAIFILKAADTRSDVRAQYLLNGRLTQLKQNLPLGPDFDLKPAGLRLDVLEVHGVTSAAR